MEGGGAVAGVDVEAELHELVDGGGPAQLGGPGDQIAVLGQGPLQELGGLGRGLGHRATVAGHAGPDEPGERVGPGGVRPGCGQQLGHVEVPVQDGALVGPPPEVQGVGAGCIGIRPTPKE